MVIGLIVFKNYSDYDKTSADYLTNLLLFDSSIFEDKLLEIVKEASILLINSFVTLQYIKNKIMEVGVPTAIIIHEQDLELFNSNKIAEKIIDIRTKTTEEGIKEFLGVV